LEVAGGETWRVGFASSWLGSAVAERTPLARKKSETGHGRAGARGRGVGCTGAGVCAWEETGEGLSSVAGAGGLWGWGAGVVWWAAEYTHKRREATRQR